MSDERHKLTDIQSARVRQLVQEVPENVRFVVIGWWWERKLTAGQALERLAALMGLSIRFEGEAANHTAEDLRHGRLPDTTAEVRPFTNPDPED
jgi:hypothetical protein